MSQEGGYLLHAHLKKKHMNRLSKGHNIQLKHEELHDMFHNEPNVELHMNHKHAQSILKSYDKGKGVRIQHKHLHGGKISFGKIARQAKEGIVKAFKHPVVKRVAKNLGHLAVEVATKKAAERGYDAAPYAELAHKAIESKDVQDQLQDQVANDVMDYAHAQAGGRISFGKITRQAKEGIQKAFKHPVVKRVAKNLGHLAVEVATKKAAERGYDAAPYAELAHQAIESKNVQDQLQDQVANDVVNYAQAQAGMGVKRKRGRPKKGGDIDGGRIKPSMKVFKSIGRTLNQISRNPLVNTIVSAGVQGAMGAGARPGKGSSEMHARMARLRALKKSKHGGSLFP